MVIAKVFHEIPAWWGFTAASDKQKLDAFIRRGVRLKFCNHNDPTMAELVDELDQTKRHELTLAIRRVAILETSSNDFCLKTCINILNIFFQFSPHVSCNLLRFANCIINLYMYVCIAAYIIAAEFKARPLYCTADFFLFRQHR